MKINDVRPASFVKQIRCDRCDRLAEVGDAELEFQEFVSIDLKVGYTSIFGDGNHVQVDLCQYCLKDVLGPWLRIDAPSAKSPGLFDPDRHGDEFLHAADASLQEPDDLQVQGRTALNEPPALRRRQAEFVRRGREAIKRSVAAGDWIPAEEVIEKLRAKVDAARQRRDIGMLNGKLDSPANFDATLTEDVLQDLKGPLTTDTKLTVTTRTKDDPGFVEALLDEVIGLAANGEPELAKRVLRDLIAGAKR